VISSGRPKGGIEGLRFHRLEDWPPGIYEGPPLLWTRLVVMSELPVTPDTLLLRLLGAGQVLQQAIAELKALRTEDPARSLALPLLVGLRLEIPTDPAQRTDDDQEFLMQTQDIVETWRQEAIQEGLLVAQVKALLTVLRARGIAVPDAAQRRIQAERDLARLERWLERASVASSVAEVIDDATGRAEPEGRAATHSPSESVSNSPPRSADRAAASCSAWRRSTRAPDRRG
jgi:post-segregation antitoxin (ccd killing protein)